MARKAIVTYNFKDSAIFLYTAKSKLSSWKEVCSQQVYPEVSNYFLGKGNYLFSFIKGIFKSFIEIK